jgi:hypothetical protein
VLLETEALSGEVLVSLQRQREQLLSTQEAVRETGAELGASDAHLRSLYWRRLANRLAGWLVCAMLLAIVLVHLWARIAPHRKTTRGRHSLR